MNTLRFRPLSKQGGFMVGISLAMTRNGKRNAAPVSSGFFLLANGTDKFLLANGVDKFLTAGS